LAGDGASGLHGFEKAIHRGVRSWKLPKIVVVDHDPAASCQARMKESEAVESRPVKVYDDMHERELTITDLAEPLEDPAAIHAHERKAGKIASKLGFRNGEVPAHLVRLVLARNSPALSFSPNSESPAKLSNRCSGQCFCIKLATASLTPTPTRAVTAWPVGQIRSPASAPIS
jgi:hypothetical protein